MFLSITSQAVLNVAFGIPVGRSESLPQSRICRCSHPCYSKATDMPFGIATTRHLSHHATSVPAFGQHGTIAGFFGALGGRSHLLRYQLVTKVCQTIRCISHPIGAFQQVARPAHGGESNDGTSRSYSHIHGRNALVGFTRARDWPCRAGSACAQTACASQHRTPASGTGRTE